MQAALSAILLQADEVLLKPLCTYGQVRTMENFKAGGGRGQGGRRSSGGGSFGRGGGHGY